MEIESTTLFLDMNYLLLTCILKICLARGISRFANLPASRSDSKFHVRQKIRPEKISAHFEMIEDADEMSGKHHLKK